MSRESCVQLHDDLIEAYFDEKFQKRLQEAWSRADGKRMKEQKAKRELCLPLQLPIMQKHGFEPTEKGVFTCLWAVRTTFFNFTKPEDVDAELMYKASLLDFLASWPS